jgi:hypothetical protein
LGVIAAGFFNEPVQHFFDVRGFVGRHDQAG